jgi:hypothetical protein
MLIIRDFKSANQFNVNQFQSRITELDKIPEQSSTIGSSLQRPQFKNHPNQQRCQGAGIRVEWLLLQRRLSMSQQSGTQPPGLPR